MPIVVFFHNERADDARRTGLSVDRQRLLDYFVPGQEESSPALRWYFDMVFEPEDGPDTADEARRWVVAHADTIRRLLEQTADQLAAGLDLDLVPWTFEYPTDDGSVRVSLSAVRMFDARRVADHIRGFLATDFRALTASPALAG